MNGKGDKERIADRKKFREGMDRIYKPKPAQIKPKKTRTVYK